MTQEQQDKRWDPISYDEKHSYVWKYGANVLALLNPKKGERILDLGCGTGHLTADIARVGAEVLGVDRDEAMIVQARERYPNVRFDVADATNLEFDEAFDAVFSNAVLHWVRPPEKAAASIAKALRPGGRLVAEFGGKGNIRLLRAGTKAALEACGIPAANRGSNWFFPSMGEYCTMLEAEGLVVTQAVLFDRPTRQEDGEDGLDQWYDTFGGEFFTGLSEAKRAEVIARAHALLRPQLWRDGAWSLDYRRFRLVAEKPTR